MCTRAWDFGLQSHSKCPALRAIRLPCQGSCCRSTHPLWRMERKHRLETKSDEQNDAWRQLKFSRTMSGLQKAKRSRDGKMRRMFSMDHNSLQGKPGKRGMFDGTNRRTSKTPEGRSATFKVQGLGVFPLFFLFSFFPFSHFLFCFHFLFCLFFFFF